jgi:hypothetical protein
MLFDLNPELSGSKCQEAINCVEELVRIPLACLAKVFYCDVDLEGFRPEDAKETDSHLLSKLLKDHQNNYIVWLTNCLIESSPAILQGNPELFVFPFKDHVTFEELHESFKSWMEVKGKTDPMCKSIDRFYRALKNVAPNCLPPSSATATCFKLDWREFESGILLKMDIDPKDPENIDNSPFRRVCHHHL